MARDPNSTWKPLPEAPSQGSGNTKTQFIVHSTGTLASAAANWNYFARADVVVESTFIVGLTAKDPTLQLLDSTAVADANGSANKRGISVETVGDGIGPFTDWQISELIRLGRWAHDTHGIPLRVIPSEAGGGYGWHVMFGAPGPWTSVRGKVCPGDARVQQLKTLIFPSIFAGLLSPAKPNPQSTTQPSTQEDDDMPYNTWPKADKDQLVKDVSYRLLREEVIVDLDKTADARKTNPQAEPVTISVGDALAHILQDGYRAATRQD